MDPRRFGPKKTGKVVEIPSHGGFAFEPSPLPVDWVLPTSFWPEIVRVQRKMGELEGVGKILKNPQVLLRPVRNREVLDSSTIEGTYATPRELLLFDTDAVSAGRSSDSVREVVNYARAIEIYSDRPNLTFDDVKDIQRMLLTGTKGEEKQPGEVRDGQVAVGATARFVPPPPESLPALIANLDYHIQTPTNVDPLIAAFIQHYQFEAIHPFWDGNGRAGRTLMALTIHRNCGFTKPWLFLSSYFEKHRDRYIERLFNVSTNGDWSSWIEFCLAATMAQTERTLAMCHAVIALQNDFENRISQLSEGASFRLQQIVGLIFDRQYLQISKVAKTLDVTYPTARADLKKLEELKIVGELPGLTPKTYSSPELFRIAYES
jgi:Fic family protein